MSKLLVLTKHYPYSKGETAAESYLESEVDYLASTFDEVMFAATESPVNRRSIQSLPKNVRSVSLGNVQTKKEKALCTAAGFLQNTAQAKKAVNSEPELELQRRIFQRYFVGKASRKWMRLIPLLELEGFDPTHVYSFWFYDTALIATWLKERYRCKNAVARAHGYDLYEERTRMNYLPCRESLLEGLDAVLPCSVDGASRLASAFPIHAHKIHTAFLGTRDLPDRSLNSRGKPFHVVSCSSAVPVKRLKLICDAMALLDTEGARIVWTHYGEGPDLDAVRKAASRFSCIEVHFPGNIPNSELLIDYASSCVDLFVNASESEGLPISIMEASGFGIPILATDVGGTHEIVQQGINGHLVSKLIDGSGLAAAIRVFYEMSENDRSLYRRRARQVWERNFRVDDNVKILLDHLLQEKNSGRACAKCDGVETEYSDGASCSDGEIRMERVAAW